MFYEAMNEIKRKTQPDLIEHTSYSRVREQPGWPASFCVNLSVVSTDYGSIQRKITVYSASNPVSSSPPTDCIISTPFWSCHVNFSTLAILLIIHMYFNMHFLSLPGWFMVAFLPVLFPSPLDHVYPASVCANAACTHTTSAYLYAGRHRAKPPQLSETFGVGGKENVFDGKCKGLTDNSDEKLWGGNREEGRWTEIRKERRWWWMTRREWQKSESAQISSGSSKGFECSVKRIRTGDKTNVEKGRDHRAWSRPWILAPALPLYPSAAASVFSLFHNLNQKKSLIEANIVFKDTFRLNWVSPPVLHQLSP